MTTATEVIEWQHPNRGYIFEPVCQQHSQEIRAALHLLGIGSGGRFTRSEVPCNRCGQHLPARMWLEGHPTLRLLNDGPV